MAGVYKSKERSGRTYDEETYEAHEQQRQKVASRVGDTAAEGADTTEEKPSEELDDLLDSIDKLLEVNAEEFVKSYVQKGGE